MRLRVMVTVVCSLLTICGMGALTTPAATAAGCPDVEVIFARGTAEAAPMTGLTGISFGEALRSQLPGKSVSVYGVDYPASADFFDTLPFIHTVLKGISDTQNRIRFNAINCPKTRLVVGGYSQGAAVVVYATGPAIPVPPAYTKYKSYAPVPLPPDLASHVAAVVLFGPPSEAFLRQAGAPPLVDNPLLAPRTARYCIVGDTVCNGSPIERPNALHVLYTVNGMTLQGAQFAVQHLN